jgi:hypothetical protein
LTTVAERKQPVGATGKQVLEIVLMPLVVAAVGSGATFFITRYQTLNSERVAAAQLANSERIARSDRELKALELFSRMIASKEERERSLAVRLLGAVDPELAGRLGNAVAEDKAEAPSVRAEAKEVAQRSSAGYGFPVVGSFRKLDDALQLARRLRESVDQYPIEIHLAENDYYAVTLGSYLDTEESQKRVEFARQRGISADAYVYWSPNWGENLFR